jgi:Tetratricopeptide repeat
VALGPLHRETVVSLALLANAHGRFGEPDRLLQMATQALERARAGVGQQRPHEALVTAERVHAYAVRRSGRPADAIPLLQQVLRDSRTLDAADSPRVRSALMQLGISLGESGRLHEAIDTLQQAIDIDTRYRATAQISRQPQWLNWAMAQTLATARQHTRALPMLQELQAAGGAGLELPSTFAPPVPVAVPLLRMLVYAGQQQDATRVAQPLIANEHALSPESLVQLREALALQARLQGQPQRARDLAEAAWAHPLRGKASAMAQAQLAAEAAAAWLDLRDARRAQPHVHRALALMAAQQLAPSPQSATAWIAQARLHLAAGRAAEAEAVMTPLVERWAEVNPGSPWHGESLVWLARAQVLQGKTDSARATIAAALPMLGDSRLPALLALRDRRGASARPLS